MKMTVNRAMGKLNIVKDRLDDALNNRFVDSKKLSAKTIKGVSPKEYADMLRGNLDRVTKLQKEYVAIKNGILASNAITKVVVADEEYSIAEAIAMKNFMRERNFALEVIQDQYKSAVNTVESNNKSAAKEAERTAETVFSGKEKSQRSEEYEAIVNGVIERNSYELIDPNGLKRFIDEERARIDSFMNEVDSVLVESNATTFIEVDIETL